MEQVLNEAEGAEPAAREAAHQGADEAEIAYDDGSQVRDAARGVKPDTGQEVLHGPHRTGEQGPGAGVAIEPRMAHRFQRALVDHRTLGKSIGVGPQSDQG
jgi:hypothetical protein